MRPESGSEGRRVASSRERARKPLLLIAVAGGVLLLDRVTKQWVVDNFGLHESVPVLGDFFRLTYTHNFGAAFGLHVGEYSRAFFLVLALVALAVLGYLYWHTPPRRKLRLYAIALVCGGAVGNVVDRVRYARGVVDFLDVGVGTFRWPVFNVADMAVSVGALLLLLTFYREDREEASGRLDAVGQPEDEGDERVAATGRG